MRFFQFGFKTSHRHYQCILVNTKINLKSSFDLISYTHIIVSYNLQNQCYTILT